MIRNVPSSNRANKDVSLSTADNTVQSEHFKDMNELYRVIRNCHDVLRNEKPHMIEAFDELSKILFAKIFDEIQSKEGNSSSFSINPSEQGAVSAKIVHLFNLAKKRFPFVYDEKRNGQIIQIDLAPSTISKVAQILQRYKLLDAKIDIKGGAYEAFLGSSLPVGKVVGQFFTPKEIVDFCVEFLDPDISDKILDPSVGTGGFLTSSMVHIWNNLKTYRSPYEENVAKQKFVLNNLYGIDIDSRMVRLAKMNILLYGNAAAMPPDATLRIHSGNGLALEQEIKDSLFTKIFTNPPFGSKESDESVLKKFETGKERVSRSSPVLFLERCVNLLYPGGKLAIVIPDSILSNSSNADIRKLITEKMNLIAVIKLPTEAFLPYGSTAESSILFMQKKPCSIAHEIFMAEAKYVGYNALGEKTKENDLPQILQLYKGSEKELLPQGNKITTFKIKPEEINDRLDVRFYHRGKDYEISSLLSRSEYPIVQLREVVNFKKEAFIPSRQQPDKFFRYIGLGNVESRTGRLVFRDQKEENIRMRGFNERTLGKDIQATVLRTKKGDILFGRMRPYLKKVIIIPDSFDDAVCSTEFTIIEPDRNRIDPEYLACLLRSDIILEQISHTFTGIGRVRTSSDVIAKVKIPVPTDITTQREIARILLDQEQAIVRKREEAARLSSESHMVAEDLERTIRTIVSFGISKQVNLK